MSQIITDVMVVVLLAVAFLLPKASLGLSPAIPTGMGAPVERERLAELEDALFADPQNETIACDLADQYLQLDQSEWALQTLSPFAASGNFRPHLGRATAFAERFYAKQSVAEAEKGVAACAHDATCGESGRMRLAVIEGAMQSLVDQHIDGLHDPHRAKEAIAKVLRAAKSPVALPTAPKAAPANAAPAKKPNAP